MNVRPLAAVGATMIILAASACAPEADTSPTPAPSTGNPCAKDQLKLITAGTFTVGTDTPAYEPWFAEDTPANGKGYESAVAYATAAKLGFAASEVKWITVPFNNSFAPGEKDFDVDINQVSITADRKQAVDFSSGYYDVTQVVITTKRTPFMGATTIVDLQDAKLGAQVGTTSYDAITNQVKPRRSPASFDTNDLAVTALRNGQIDALVVDLPTAFYMVAAQLNDEGVIIGQLPTPAGATPDQFGFVLDKGSTLTSCVSGAVDGLRSDGTLAKLAKQWLSADGAARVLS